MTDERRLRFPVFELTAAFRTVEDFEQRAADISVDYPDLVTDYRGLHMIAVKEADDQVSTEEMRQEMVHGRALFEELVRKETPETATQKEKI